MLNRFIGFFSVLAVFIMLLMMIFTTPSAVGPVGVLLFFTMIYVALFGVAVLCVKIFMKLQGKKELKFKDYIYAAVITFGPIWLILLQSFGQLNILTLVAVILAVSIGCFITNKRL